MDKLPASLDAERAILGAILLDNFTFWQCDRLASDDFFDGRHNRIYRAMCKLMMDEQRPVDFVTLCEHLNLEEETDDLGQVVYITNLTDGLPRVKNISQYVNIVLERSQRRKLIRKLESATQDAYSSECEVDELIARTDRQLLEIQTRQKSGPKKLIDILPEADAQLDEQLTVDMDRKAVGLRTGLDELDEMTTGYRKREVTVIAGETSDGKSSLMRQGLIANLAEGRKCLLFSLEVSREQVALDLKTFASSLPSNIARDFRRASMFERQKFKDANQLIKGWPFWVCDTPNLHADELVATARRYIRLEGVGSVWIDFVQLVSGNGGNKTEKVEYVCDRIWHLSDSEKIPVIALSQLSRDGDKDKKVRPKLRRLKHASDIEQRAHNLIFVFQPEDEKGRRQNNQAEIIIAKQRHGPTGVIPAEFLTDELRFKYRPKNNY